MKNHLPRKGQYELFINRGKTYCFDDPSFEGILSPPKEMFEWLRSLPIEDCRPMDHTNVAFYLTPQMYLIWKLKWA
jgi:hypothetical protein